MNRTATELAILLTLSCGSSALHAAGQASTATTAALSPVQLSKVDPVVVQTARAGETQRVLVRIDAHDISERLEKVQQTRGDEAFVSETVREMDALKAAIFPGARLGRVTVVTSYSMLPLVFVEIPDFAALSALLAHPRVLRVDENKRVYPTDAKGPS